MDRSLLGRPAAGERDADATRRPDHGQSDGVAPVLCGGPAGSLLGLQRLAGNAAVVQMLQRRAALVPPPAAGGGAGLAPTAPVPGSTDEEEAALRAAEARAANVGADVGDLGVDLAPVDDPQQEHTPEERAQKREQDDESPEPEEHVEPGGGPVPIGAADVGSGFVDGGRQSSVPFTDSHADRLDPERDLEPHAFTTGGKTGGAAWAGGGGAGPKGNEPSGSIQNQVDPVYESESVGPFHNANAWVVEGTGVADVKRTYVTSSAGDQGNGWWVSDKAAAALERHEQKHVKASRDVYESKLQPALDKVAMSPVLGFGKTYWARDAKTLLAKQVGWAPAVKGFDEDDKQYNAPHGVVDTEDQGSPWYPKQRGAGQVSGKDFTNRLLLGSEPDPE